MTPFEVYTTYLAFKNHFSKQNYDYFKYCGRSRASLQSFYKRKDRFFFERMSRQRNDEEIKAYFVANFTESANSEKLWIGEIIRNGEDIYDNWLKKSQSLSYIFKEESQEMLSEYNLNDLFDCSRQHPPILKKYLGKIICLETLVIHNKIFDYVKDFDKKLMDPVWETVRLKILKYDPFLNIDVAKYKKIIKEIVL